MKLTFHGAAQEVGRSCIEVNGKYLFDAGLKLGTELSEYPTLTYAEHIRAVFLSHAHLDHTGALPLLNHNGLHCSVYCTKMTKALTKILLQDSIHIEMMQHKHPAYGKDNVLNVLSFMQQVQYHKKYKLDDGAFTFLNSGHIPGSASVLLELNGKQILYTGDLNTANTQLLDGATYTSAPDILIIESTYGSRDHPSREKTEQRFLQAVEKTLKQNGSVLIPSFSVGRAQELLLVLSRKRWNVPVYLDGMAKKVTDIILSMPEYIKNVAELKHALKYVEYVQDFRHRQRIVEHQGIFISTAGMLDGGPVIDYVKHLHHDKNNSILLTGYQAEGCNGRLLLEEGCVYLDGMRTQVAGYVEQFDFSAHCGRNELLAFVDHQHPKTVVINHGDEGECADLAAALRKKKYTVFVPKVGETIDLSV